MAQEIHVIQLTDMQLHTNVMRNPVPWYKKIMKAIRSKKPDRLYGGFKSLGEVPSAMNEKGVRTMKFQIPMSGDLQKEIEAAQAQGKIIKFVMPEGGIPIYLGKDAKEKMEALKKKKQRSHGTRYFRKD